MVFNIYKYKVEQANQWSGIWCGLLLGFYFFATTDTFSQNKSQFHLFNPTPKDQMREMHTDRPDVTETPYTVDAGRLQFEFDFLNLYRHPINRRKGETDIRFLNGIAKVGLTDYLDFEVIFSANEWHFPDSRSTLSDTLRAFRSGFGDIGFRTKINLLGNKHEEYGIAIMPSLLLPLNNAASEQIYIPGISAIWAYSLNNKMELGGQFEYFRLFDIEKQPMFNEYWGTIEVSYDITNRVMVFTEYVAIISENNNYLHTYNAGVVYEINPNFRIDLAFNLGLNSLSPSTIFSGFSFRLL